jgi:hypothetical protein
MSLCTCAESTVMMDRGSVSNVVNSYVSIVGSVRDQRICLLPLRTLQVLLSITNVFRRLPAAFNRARFLEEPYDLL